MLTHEVTPILNVSDIEATFAWFLKLGWEKAWDWGKGPNPRTFGPDGDPAGDKGVWMSVWVDDVDAVHRRCLEEGLDVTWPPTEMPWGVREMHVRHPDGHVFRISRGIAGS